MWKGTDDLPERPSYLLGLIGFPGTGSIFILEVKRSARFPFKFPKHWCRYGSQLRTFNCFICKGQQGAARVRLP